MKRNGLRSGISSYTDMSNPDRYIRNPYIKNPIGEKVNAPI